MLHDFPVKSVFGIDDINAIKEIQDIDFIFSPDGPIKQLKDDYIPRPSQVEAAKEMFLSLKGRFHYILEGPCGFGKSFAYLVPLMEYLYDRSGAKAVIVTNGISLQEQLLYKDIPLVQNIFNKMFGYNLKAAILKGKQNFACVRKTNEAIASGIFLTQKHSEEFDKILEWFKKTVNGDLSELDFVPDKEILREITCSKDGECMGKRCKHAHECHYRAHRERASSADIICCNYHILFSDLEIGAGTLLPKYDVLLFDEAHEIATVYRDFKTVKFSAGTVRGIKADIQELRNKYRIVDAVLDDAYEGGSVGGIYPYLEALTDLQSATEEYMDKLYQLHLSQTKWIDNKVIDSTTELADKSVVMAKFDSVTRCIEAGAGYLEEEIDRMGDEADDDTVAGYQGLEKVLAHIVKIKKMILDYHTNPDVEDVVYYIERDKDNETASTHFKPVSVGPLLNRTFFSRGDLSCILTSATLSVGDKFDYIKVETGLDLCEKDTITTGEIGEEYIIPGRTVRGFIGSSPFNLTEQQLWYLPEKAVDGNTKEFDEKILDLVSDTVAATRGGALCLFTSVKNMNACYNYMRAYQSMMRVKIMKQGDKPKIKLLEDFKDTPNTVLLATKSFFTGVDVPGEALRCLIIDKLPFPSPGDPVMQKLGKDSNAFFKYFIPMMIILLKQAVGRGVRSVTDKCVITILDNRMATARYRTRIYDSFAYQKTSTRDIQVVKRFIDDYIGAEKIVIEQAMEAPPYFDDDIPF